MRGEAYRREDPWTPRILALPRHGDEADPCRQKLEEASIQARRDPS
ncbi:MAG: hypothetical protein Q9Q13_01995 [Acidobacteriota bacterium]|nr:hypothetical protein [Acidobacteriota bacterium]